MVFFLKKFNGVSVQRKVRHKKDEHCFLWSKNRKNRNTLSVDAPCACKFR